MFYNYDQTIDFDTKYKICIAVSGETRNYNTTTPLQLEKFINKLKSLNYEVYVVAHTWAHCEIPKDFKLINDLRVDDQSVIDRWVMEDFLNRAPNGHNKSPIDINSKSAINNKLQEARRNYGQCWSAFRSFEMFNNGKIPECDLLIRWRWDLGIDNFIPSQVSLSQDQINTLMECNFAYMNTHMRLMVTEFDKKFGVTDGTGGIHANCNGWDTKNFVLPTLNDRFMIFNKPAAGILASTDFPRLLDNILRISTKVENFNGHTLWYTVILNQHISMCIDLPQITNVMRG
jgi:hypothetical protein